MLTEEQIAALQSEVEKLRSSNAELVARHAKDKTRLAELETQNADLQGKLAEADKTIKAATVDGPLRRMADEVSKVPELFLEQFSKHYKLEMQDGKLTLLSTDGKPVTGKDGKTAIPFERDALTKLLTEGDDARAKTFQAILIATRASGAGSSPGQTTLRTAPVKAHQFGLR